MCRAVAGRPTSFDVIKKCCLIITITNSVYTVVSWSIHICYVQNCRYKPESSFSHPVMFLKPIEKMDLRK